MSEWEREWYEAKITRLENDLKVTTIAFLVMTILALLALFINPA